jgi:hypothetical protein
MKAKTCTVGGPRSGTRRYPTNMIPSTISRNSFYDLSFLTFDPKMPSYSESEDKAGGCVVRATNSAQQANALDTDEYTYVLALTSPIAFSLGDTEI